MASSTSDSASSSSQQQQQQPIFENTSILDTFHGRNLFLTGCTGFVGKVLLEKILRSIPNVGKIYLLVRPRKGSTAEQRFHDEVISSECFNRLRNELGLTEFNTLIQQKCYPVIGELTQSNVGISPEMQLQLQNDVNIVLHCAAVVDFNERLDRAIELNVLGTLRMLDLAKSCKNIAGFVHVSTCYTNSNRRGWIDEKVYPLGFEPEEILKRVGNMHSSELERLAGTGFLGEWPNTYTYTKAITENLVSRRRGHVPVAIVRPSIVGAAYKEPVPGWVDALTAAGAVYIAVGLGVLKFLPGKMTTVSDIVPVDYVVNAIIAAVPAIANRDTLLVCHASTSTQKPMRWGHALEPVLKYFTLHPAPRRLGKPKFRFIPTPQEYQLQFFLRYSIPSSLLGTVAETPFLTNAALRTKSALLNKLLFRVRLLTESFRHFVENEWNFNNKNTRALWQGLNDSEKSTFSLDLSDLDWLDYNYNFCYGIMKFCLHADMIEIEPTDSSSATSSNAITQSPSVDALQDSLIPAHTGLQQNAPLPTYEYMNEDRWKPPTGNESITDRVGKALFWDTQWVYQRIQQHPSYTGTYPKQHTITEMKRIVLSSTAVKRAIDAEVANSKSKLNVQSVTNRATGIADLMFGTIETRTISSLAYSFRKIWRRIYSAIRIDKKQIARCQECAKQAPLIYIPTHRSYIDFLILSYVALAVQLPIPYIAAGEDFLGIKGIRTMLRNAGAFFIRRSFAGDELYTTIFSEYVTQLLCDGQSVEFFIEGTRSRSGKMLHPKTGMLSMITDAQLAGRLPPNVHIVPITINYEKIIEENLYSNELLGDSKVRESLRNLFFKGSSVLSVNFGAIDIALGEPVLLSQYIDEHIAQTPTVTLPKHIREKHTSVFVTTAKSGAFGATTIEDTGRKTVAKPDNKPSTTAAQQDSTINYATHKHKASELTPTPTAEQQQQLHPDEQSPSTDTHRQQCQSPHLESNSVEMMTEAYQLQTNPRHRKYFNRQLSYRIVGDMTRMYAAMPTHLLAAIIAMYRQGITKHQLVEKMEWLRREIKLRGGQCSGFEGESRVGVVDRAITQLNGMIIQRQKNLFEPNISNRQQYKNMLGLGLYRNKIIHLFFREGVFACALYSFGERLAANSSGQPQGITKSELIDEVRFLTSLLYREFIWKRDVDSAEDFEATLALMVQRQILAVNANDNTVEVSPSGEAHFSFLCSLFWPFIDSYYVACMVLFTLQPDREIEEQVLLQRTQWLATTLYHESMLTFYEACNLDTLRNAFAVLHRWGVVHVHRTIVNPDPKSAAQAASSDKNYNPAAQQKIITKISLVEPYTQERALQELVQRISKLRKQPPVRKNALTRNLIADIPILAKL